MLITVTAVLTATAAIYGWWKVRRALIAERAARRLTEAAMHREHHAGLDAAWARHQQILAESSQVLHRSLRDRQVLAAAGAIVDRAYAAATSTPSTENDRRGDSDV